MRGGASIERSVVACGIAVTFGCSQPTEAVVGAAVVAEPPPSPEPSPEPSPTPSTVDPASHPPVVLHLPLRAGQGWEEQVVERLFILEHPVQPPSHEPITTMTRTERFEVVEVTPVHTQLSVTWTGLVFELREGEQARVFRSEALPRSFEGVVAERMAPVGVPLQWSLPAAGGGGHQLGAREHATAVLERFDELAAAVPSEERTQSRKTVQEDLQTLETKVREWGLRPPLPPGPVAVGTTWAQIMRLPSLFDATVEYTVQYQLDRLDDREAVISFHGRGVLEPTATMARFMEDEALEIEGSLRIDHVQGLLLEQRDAVSMRAVLRPEPGVAGRLAGRLERVRTRVGT